MRFLGNRVFVDQDHSFINFPDGFIGENICRSVQSIFEDLEAVLEYFREIANDLGVDETLEDIK